MKKTLIIAALLLACMGSKADNTPVQQAKQDLLQKTTLGGYIIGRAAFNDRDISTANTKHSDFDLRLVRGYVKGTVLDFAYMLQIEYEGYGGAKEKGPHIVDAYAQWQKYDFLRIKAGQFKRAFTFENPTNPWDISFGGYSQLVDRLAGMNDRNGEHSSGGRDAGIQVNGDLFKSHKDGHPFVSYQLGVYNGQGINHNDVNSHKDLIGNITINPFKELSVAFFGWTGNYAKNGITVDRNRMAWGLRYAGPLTVRAEYGVSEGHKISDYTTDASTGARVLKEGVDDGADAWYVMTAVPVTKDKKLRVQGKWDVYRDQKTWGTSKSIYALGAEYWFYKNLKLQANYAYNNDKTTTLDSHYNTFDLQLYVRF